MFIDCGDMEVELADVGAGDFATFEFDGQVSQRGCVEEQQIDEQFVTIDVEAVLTALEREPCAEFEEETFDVGDELALDFSFDRLVGEPEEVEVVWVFDQLLHQLGFADRKQSVEVGRGGAGPGP